MIKGHPLANHPIPNRRAFLQLAAGALVNRATLASAAALHPALSDRALHFSQSWLNAHAADLATRPFEPIERLEKTTAALDYDGYRSISYRREAAVWAGDRSPYRLELFHGGYLYQEVIEISVVENGLARAVVYDPNLFQFRPPLSAPPQNLARSFSGFRILGAVQQGLPFDEFAVFQGASYFRCHAPDQEYGLSARGLGIDTGRPTGEEFPIFRQFWVEKPEPAATTIKVHALLDSISATGAFTFEIGLAQNTVMDVDCTITPRRQLDHAGIGNLTSMFFIGPASLTQFEDYRPRVHDSEGLAILNGNGEWLWRPLNNPRHVQTSEFLDKSPKGFGLIQRNRNAKDYQDLIALSERRPSAWLQPLDDWGEGSITLVELPTRTEHLDNIVAFWRPKQPLQQGQAYRYRYRLSWCETPPVVAPLATVFQTRNGFSVNPLGRFFVIDFRGGVLDQLALEAQPLLAAATQAPAELVNLHVLRNPIDGGWRATLFFKQNSSEGADISAHLVVDGQRVSEIWMYRWSV